MSQEIGRVGQKRYAGVFYEEFLPELSGKRGIETFKEMANNDDIIFAMLYAIEMLLRQTKFNFEPASDKTIDKGAADFVEGCLNDMQATWQDTLSEILSFITYGWSYHEIVYKRRCGRSKDPRYSSKYDDKLIGWRKLPIRSQDTLSHWEYDPVTDELKGMVQVVPPNYTEVLIPIEKALHFRTRSAKENPEGRSVLRGAYRCFDEKTEILTKSGWKFGKDITLADELATLNPTSNCLEYEVPSEIHRYRHTGKMIHFTSKFIDILVTDNHRMWVKKDRSNHFEFVEAKDVKKSHSIMRYAEWTGSEEKYHHLPAYYSHWKNNGKEQQRLDYKSINIQMDDWAAFLALFLSEGCTTLGHKKQKIVSISQGKCRAEGIRKLLNKLPFHYYEHFKRGRSIVQFEFCNAQLYMELKPFGKSKDKFVPQYIKELSPRQINIFLKWYMFGDGMQVGNTAGGYEGTPTLGTISERMANDLQELGLKAGYESQISVDVERNLAIGKNPFYKISLCKRKEHKIKTINYEDYNGAIWCPTTRNGIVYVRRNGKPAWVGNCWYFKKRIQEIEGIGVERDLAGFPVLHAPPQVSVWDKDDPAMLETLANAQRIVTSIRRDTQEGIVLPDGWTLDLLSAGGKRNFDTNQIIERYDKRIAMTTLADFILLGQQSAGSFALSSDKTALFGTAMGTYLDIVCDVFNTQAIPRLIDLNAEHFSGFTDYPRMTHGDIEDVDLTALGGFLQQVVGCGALIPDEGLDDYLRQAAHLPVRTDDYVPTTPPVEEDEDSETENKAARNVHDDSAGAEQDADMDGEDG